MSSTFISHLTRNDVDCKNKKETFISYVDITNDQEEENDEELDKRASTFFQTDLKPQLLHGEHVVTEADSVLSFTSFSDRKQGISGKLFITNFKVTFVTADRSSYEVRNKGKRQRNNIIEDCDIPLTSIDSIYQVLSGGKRRELTPGTTVSSLSKYLEIYCKDFSVHVFGFKFSSKDQNKKVANAIVHHAYPTKSYLLFAYDYGRSCDPKRLGSVMDTPLFTEHADWERELNRCRCTKWWVSVVNEGFRISTSLPEKFVVPCGLLDSDLIKASNHFVEGRVPTWCYTHPNGVSLVRMAYLIPDTDMSEYEGKMLSAIQLADQDKGPPVVKDLSEICPSLKDIQQSYEKLKELCFIDSQKDFIVQDITWMSSLGNTKWLNLVAQCLDGAIEVVNTIDTDRKTVVLRESDSRNFSCLISSLSQIMMDPNFRSRVGFQSLVQREWVMMGYPFQKHLGLVSKNAENQVPLFLLFLDCVWQLLQQFPSEFGFSETYLTTLWDSLHVGVFETFLFDSCYQRKKFFSDGKCLRKCLLPSVWNWNFQFSQEEQHFFNNPLYLMKHNSQLNRGIFDAVLESRNSKINLSLQELYAKKLGDVYDDEEDKILNSKSLCLIPVTSAPVIKLWSQCYLRWQTPCQIVGGGNPSQYLQQCLFVEEIIHLEHKLQSLKRKQLVRPRSDLIFSLAVDTPTDQELLNSTYLTSSFPFTPGVTQKTQQMMMNMPISVYLQNSAFSYDYNNDDDD